MARASLKEREQKAAQARGRMARRAKRARFFKENKKRILIAFLAFLVLNFLAFFTPWGPDYYYTDIQMRKFENPRTISPGVLEDLYKLGRFYSFTLRKNQAKETYAEIAKCFYGFTFEEYAQSPTNANEKRFQALRSIAREESNGPPYKVADSDIKYVGLAMYYTAEIMMESGPKSFPANLYNELYNEFKEENPSHLDPDITRLAKMTGDRLRGRR